MEKLKKIKYGKNLEKDTKQQQPRPTQI